MQPTALTQPHFLDQVRRLFQQSVSARPKGHALRHDAEPAIAVR